jgi:hypothetical protein
MIIHEQDTYTPPILTEAEIKYAHNVINQWEIVQKVMESPGWKILTDYFESQLRLYDSISNARPDDIRFRQGVVFGIDMLLQSPKRLKTNATSAIEKLETGLAEEEE